MAENTYTIALAKNAEVVEFTYAQADLAEDFHFSAGNWYPSFGTNVAVGDSVTPTFDTAGVSLPGTWLVSASTYDIAPVTTAHVRWVGTGFTIEYSLNGGTSWNALVNGQAIDLSGLTNPDLDFKVTFAGGVLNDAAALISLDIFVLKTQVILSSSGVRNATISKSTTLSRVRGDQSALLTDDGAVGGYIDIAADSRAEGPVSLRTIEVWLKRNTAVIGTIIDRAGLRVTTAADGTLTIGAGVIVEVNGVAAVSGTTKLTLNTWYHVKVVYPTALSNGFRLGAYLDGTNAGNFNFFGLAMYPDVPTNTYSAAAGTLTLRVDDSSTITVSEPAQSLDMYAYAWAIVSATK